MPEPGHGIDTFLNTFDEVQDPKLNGREQGYLAIEGELHHNTECKYVRYGPYPWSYRNGAAQVQTYSMVLKCYCQQKRNLGTRTELHFSKNCRWKRIKDQTYTHQDQKNYLVRKCTCFLPEGALEVAQWRNHH